MQSGKPLTGPLVGLLPHGGRSPIPEVHTLQIYNNIVLLQSQTFEFFHQRGPIKSGAGAIVPDVFAGVALLGLFLHVAADRPQFRLHLFLCATNSSPPESEKSLKCDAKLLRCEEEELDQIILTAAELHLRFLWTNMEGAEL